MSYEEKQILLNEYTATARALAKAENAYQQDKKSYTKRAEFEWASAQHLAVGNCCTLLCVDTTEIDDKILQGRL